MSFEMTLFSYVMIIYFIICKYIRVIFFLWVNKIIIAPAITYVLF